MKYLVLWFISQTTAVPCPDFKPDEYTGELPSVMCAVYHTKTETVKMEKEFDSREDAEKFISEAKEKINFHLIEEKP